MRAYAAAATAVASLASVLAPCSAQQLRVRPEHPRVWATPEAVARLRGDAAVLKALTAPKAGALSNALAYLISGDERFGRAAISKAERLLAKGDGRLHAWPGYAKNHIHPAAICYDWCHGLLSDEDKRRFIQVMNGWADWCGRMAERESPYGSLFYGFLWGEAVVGLATHGDNPSARKWIDHARFGLFERRALPALERMGGDWLEGNGPYFGPVLLALYLEAHKTACGEDLAARTPFLRDAVACHLYASAGGYRFFYPTGDVCRGHLDSRPLYKNYPEHALFLVLARNSLGNVPDARRAEWLLRKIGGARYRIQHRMALDLYTDGAETTAVPFANALWNRPGQKLEPLGPDGLPTGFWKQKSGFVSMRASWGDKAMVIGFHSSPRLAARQHGDQNSFCVFTGDDLLMGPLVALYPHYIEGSRGRRVSYAKCTFVFDHHGQVEEPVSRESGKIIGFHNTEHFAYAVGEAAAAYTHKAWNHEPVKQFTRHLLFLRPATLLVLDRVVTRRDVVKRWGAWVRLRAAYRPSYRDRTIYDRPYPLRGPGPWHEVSEPKTTGRKPWWETAGDVLWAPLLPQRNEAWRQVVGVGALRLEMVPKDRREEDIFLAALFFGGEAAPSVVCERRQASVEVTLRGARELRVRLDSADPQRGTLTIREQGKVLFDGPLLPDG